MSFPIISSFMSSNPVIMYTRIPAQMTRVPALRTIILLETLKSLLKGLESLLDGLTYLFERLKYTRRTRTLSQIVPRGIYATLSIKWN